MALGNARQHKLITAVQFATAPDRLSGCLKEY